MADYNLGTAHGRIVVDYDDKGIGQAEKSFDRLKAKTKELLGQFAGVAQKWKGHAQSIQDGAEKTYRGFVRTGQGAAALGVGLSVLNGNIAGVHSGIKTLGDLGTALGEVPKGAENFPNVVKKIIQVSAAVEVFHGGTKLLATATRNINQTSLAFRLLTAATSRLPGATRALRLFAGAGALLSGPAQALARFGGVVNTLTGPLRAVASTALGVLSVMKGFALVKQYAKYFELFHVASTGLATALQVGLPVIASVVKSISDLGGALALAPAVVGTAALAYGALKIGLSGVGDAFKALAKGDMAAFNKALKDMAPAAKEFVLGIKSLGPLWKEIKLDVQQALFEGLGQKIKGVAELYLPMLQGRLIDVASSFNRAAKDVLEFFDSTEVANDFGEGLDYSAKAIDNISKAIAPLTRALYMVWRVGVQVFADITGGVGAAAERFADFVKEARASGALEAWMRRGVQAVKDLVASVINFGRIFKTIFQGLGLSSGQPFLQWLRKATEEFNNFLKSAKGQEILKAIGQWMADGAEHAKALADVFMNDVLPAILAFMPFIKQMGDAVNTGLVAALKVLAPIFKVLGEVLSAMAPVLAPIVTAMVFMGTVMIGLGIAAKIAAGAVAIFRVGMLALKGINFVAGLLTRLGGGFRLVGGALKLLRFGAIAAGLFLVADGINDVNLKAAGGDPTKLDAMSKTLYNIVEAGKKIASGDFAGIIAEINAQINTTGDTWSKNEAPVQKWFEKVKTSFQNDLVGPMDQFGTTVNTFITNTGNTIGTGVATWWAKVGESFDRDVIGFFKGLPAKIGAFFAGIGPAIGVAASTLWQGFLTTLKAQFQPVITFFSQTPYQMGFAIGSGIGAIIAAAINIMTVFGDNVNAGITNVLVFFNGLPARIAIALSTLGPTIFAAVTGAMTEFGNAVNTGIDNAVGFLSGFGDRANSAISNLPGLLGGTATTAGDSVNTGISTGLDTTYGVLSGFGDRANSAISNVPGILLTKGTEAGDSFNRGVTDVFNTVFTFMSNIGNRINQAIGDLGNLLVNAGRSVIDGLLAGIKAGVQAMYDFVSGIAAGIAARKGPISYDKKLLIPAGLAIIKGLTVGMQKAMPSLWRQINGVNGALGGIGGMSNSVNLNGSVGTAGVRSGLAAPAFTGGPVRGGDGGSVGDTFTIGSVTIPAKDIAEFQNVTQFFDAVQQKARAGKATK